MSATSSAVAARGRGAAAATGGASGPAAGVKTAMGAAQASIGRRMIRRITGLAVLALALLPAASARAGSYQQIFADYRADGVVSACRYSASELRAAENQIPNDIEQYAPDFPAALQSALEAHARGDCDKKAAPAPAPAPATAPPAAPQAAAPAAPQSAP